MLSPLSRIVSRLALAIAVAALSSTALSAQGSLKISAWISSRAITASGPDSAKFVLRLRISGIPEDAVRSLKAYEIVLRAKSGRVYLPFGVPPRILATASANVVAQFYQAESKSAGQYSFLVSPGSLEYELWLPGHKPVTFAASLVRPVGR